MKTLKRKRDTAEDASAEKRKAGFRQAPRKMEGMEKLPAELLDNIGADLLTFNELETTRNLRRLDRMSQGLDRYLKETGITDYLKATAEVDRRARDSFRDLPLATSRKGAPSAKN